MLMVIFGAGASYDSVPSWPPSMRPTAPFRPPLGNELFDERDEFAGILKRFSKCHPIVPYLRHRSEDETVEHVLEGLQGEAEEYPKRHQQLAAVRFYLCEMLRECQNKWTERVSGGITNYKTLLDQFQHWQAQSEEAICLVTFNYDTMLEEALPVVGVEIRKLEDYIGQRDWKVIKLHGSCDWGRKVEVRAGVRLEAEDLENQLIDRAGELEMSRKYRMEWRGRGWAFGGESRAFFPAVAIPVETKQEYECPEEHLAALRACIPEITRVLVVGWRAMEKHFLEDLLGQKLGVLKHSMVVAGSLSGAEEVIETLQKSGIGGSFEAAEKGFTEFVVGRECERFLRS